MASSYRELHDHHFRTLSTVKTPRVMRTTGWFIIFTIVMTALFLYFAPWVQTAPGTGRVIALDPNDRLQDINALVSGRIQEFYVRDGSRVKQGDPIVRIVDIDPQLIERLESEKVQVRAKLNSAETAAATAEIDLERTQSLYDEGLTSRRELEQSRIRVEQLRATVAEAAAELTRVDVNLSRQSVQIVEAPRDGVILRVNAGDSATFISAGQSVATFVPDNAGRAIELFIDGRDVGLIRNGAKVRLQFEGWPVVQFSGWPSVAIGTFGGLVVAVDPSAQDNGRFRILVSEDPEDPWPDDSFVRYGSKARGWVLLEQVSVGYEIWRQLNNFPPDYPSRLETTP
jgi:multidrug efflux pump subunit AcrA (membrane-fusion protein)